MAHQRPYILEPFHNLNHDDLVYLFRQMKEQSPYITFLGKEVYDQLKNES